MLSTLEENKAYGPPESEGKVDSVNQSFLYLVMQVYEKLPPLTVHPMDIINSKEIGTDTVQGQISSKNM